MTEVLRAIAFVTIRNARREFSPGALALGKLVCGSLVLGLVACARRKSLPRRLPADIIPWAHTGDLAEMTWLAVTQPATASQTFLAVDRNVAIGDYFMPIIKTPRPGSDPAGQRGNTEPVPHRKAPRRPRVLTAENL